MFAIRRFLVRAVCVALAAFSLNTSASLSLQLPPGLRALVQSQIPVTEAVRGIVMLNAVPSEDDVTALRGLGLQVRPLRHLPMVLAQGTPTQLLSAFQQGVARDVYLDQKLFFHSVESNAAMNANLTQELGFDGSGIGIAIVDSGIDASHPVLANRVVRNVRVYSAEYLDVVGLNGPLGISAYPHDPALVIPFDPLPYNNTDTVGHGTHVAGLAAGDGTDNPDLVGVAPGADLIGYSTGEILFIFTVLASFDDILANREAFNIRVVNNSWGSAYSVFDPDAPINVASKALYDAGITVIFSAGNSETEMSTGPNSHAPWVISSCAATVNKTKAGFSSSGLMFDNTQSISLDDNGHVRYEGDTTGNSRPDVCAPGASIDGPGTPTGVTVTTGTPPGGTATLSGTSMSAPHMAGLAAVLLQANPELTPDQIRLVMQVTAVPMEEETTFWQTGYGFVDAKAALDLVTRDDFSQALLDEMQAKADAKQLATRSHAVVASDHWMFVALGATVAGSETQEFTFEVSDTTEAIRASVAFPGDLGLLGLNAVYDWNLELVDPNGSVVATSAPIGLVPVGVLQMDFPAAQPGTWTIRAIGTLHLAQPALLWGHTVSVAVTQLKAQGTTAAPAARINAGRFGGALAPALLLVLLGAAALRRRG